MFFEYIGFKMLRAYVFFIYIPRPKSRQVTLSYAKSRSYGVKMIGVKKGASFGIPEHQTLILPTPVEVQHI